MQIFSKLQRNSTYYIFITIIAFLIALFNSTYIFFPLLLGVIIFCWDLFGAFVYIIFFAISHHYNIFYFEIAYLIYYFYLKNRFLEMFNKEYFDVIVIFYVYIVYLIYLFFYIKSSSFIYIYVIYNFSFDLLIIRFFRCEVK